MKRYRALTMLFFSLVYAVILSFGIECLLTCIGIMGTSVFGEDATGLYWFAFISGIIATALLVVIFVFNFRISERLEYNKYIWWIQTILGVILAFCLVEPWQTLFEHIRELL